MASLILLTPAATDRAQVLPALSLLPHSVDYANLEVSEAINATSNEAGCELLIIDARSEIVLARAVCRTLSAAGITIPILLLVNEGSLSLLSRDWGVTDFILPTSTPGELEARIRLLVQQALPSPTTGHDPQLSVGELTIDTTSYSVRLRGRPLDLTYREFELLRFLAQEPGHVYTRTQLLQEVWGYDYYGGTRTVDVHIRRLRAKLGPDLESIITTIRNVGYRLDKPVTKD